MSVLNENTIIGASAAGGDYEIEQSLRFDTARTTYLQRTPSAVGNRKTFTISTWVKRSNLTSSTDVSLFSAYGSGDDSGYWGLRFRRDANVDCLAVGLWNTDQRNTTAVFRDPSDWYHIVCAVDTTQSTATNRTKLYVNGVQITSFVTENNVSQNTDLAVNNTVSHGIGLDIVPTKRFFFGGYQAEFNLIDGQALTPDSFGETGTYGEWKPIAYDGTYGTNGFYLPFEQDYTVEGFSTVTYEGNGSGQYIGGVGFQPDLTWFKCRSDSSSSAINDSIRGRIPILTSNTTAAEVGGIASDDDLISWETDGFLLGHNDSANSHGRNNVNARTYVAWNWDMGGTTASNTDGSITSSVRANPTYGQSIVSWTGDGGTGTVGHGLTSAPEFWITKDRASADNWLTFFTIVDGSLDSANLNLTNAAGTGSVSLPTSSVFTNDGYTSSQNLITYAFHSVTGYSKFGSYSGNGSSTGPVVTLGFSPAFVMIKRTDAGDQWIMLDNTRSPSGLAQEWLAAESSNAEASGTSNNVQFSSTGFQPVGVDGMVNASGGTYIYMAFADTREYAYWYDQSGNNNDWTSEGGLTESDVMVDSPTNNFATFNPLYNFSGDSAIYSEGNLIASRTDTTEWIGRAGSMAYPSSGKFYHEVVVSSANMAVFIGIRPTDAGVGGSSPQGVSGSVMYYGVDGQKRLTNTFSAYGAGYVSGDIIGVAVDMDASTPTIQFYKNNAGQGTINLTVGETYIPVNALSNGTDKLNFGADSSFAGAKTPQGNQDSNDIGDFFYAPPSGFLSLCTKNLDTTDVIPSEHFNTVIWTGDASYPRSFNAGFQTDFLWIKSRSYTGNGIALDTIRGSTKALRTSTTGAETTNTFATFDSEGFNITGTFNESNETTVAWNWKAGGSASSNSNGTITSSVSANVDAGFSILTYTGTGAIAATIGHGLSSAPEMIIRKDRDAAVNWSVFHASMGTGNGNLSLFLNTTSAQDGGQGFMNNTAPTSTVFTQGDQGFVGVNGRDYIAYAFHSVDGYSKVGSYTGNGSADGTFVDCGFRPAFVVVKRTDAGGGWHILDNKRASPFNPIQVRLEADNSDAENTGGPPNTDLVSNGFKLRTTFDNMNASGGTYIFLAFAETPFKFSNAR